jgi:hypothetical protein
MAAQPLTGFEAPPPTPAPKRSALGLAIGIPLIVLGLLGGGAFWLLQSSRHERHVKNLQRALSGYNTDFTFEKAGTFTFYYEHAGAFRAQVDGGNKNVTIKAPASAPNVSLRLVDSKSAQVRLSRVVDGPTYDVGGFKGAALRQATIKRAGTYTLEVQPDDPAAPQFDIAVGIGTVDRTEAKLLWPLVIGLGGLVLGLLSILLLGRRRPTEVALDTTATTAQWNPGAAWDPAAGPLSGPPVAPPGYGAPPAFGPPPQVPVAPAAPVVAPPADPPPVSPPWAPPSPPDV